MTHKVFIVGVDREISDMFDKHEAYELTFKAEDASIHCYIGGADVNPVLYEEQKIPGTYFSLAADQRDMAHYSTSPDTFKVGICRGGQFLNVMNGGKMYQDVSNHGRTHTIVDFINKVDVEVTSTHHQMMIPHETGTILAASVPRSNYYRTDKFPASIPKSEYPKWETEVVWYEKSRSLCFQPHPEIGHESTRKYFFDTISLVL